MQRGAILSTSHLVIEDCQDPEDQRRNASYIALTFNCVVRTFPKIMKTVWELSTGTRG